MPLSLKIFLLYILCLANERGNSLLNLFISLLETSLPENRMHQQEVMNMQMLLDYKWNIYTHQ